MQEKGIENSIEKHSLAKRKCNWKNRKLILQELYENLNIKFIIYTNEIRFIGVPKWCQEKMLQKYKDNHLK